MSYGKLSLAQEVPIAEQVCGKLVHDMGCGDGLLALALARLGAREVIAVDKEEIARGWPKVNFYACRFEEYVGEADLVFLSWPVNHTIDALQHFVEKASTVIYLGKNTDSTACGWPALFTHLSTRAILKHLPERKNTLTIYGPTRLSRPMTGEEFAGTFNDGKILSFEDAGKIDVMLRGTVL